MISAILDRISWNGIGGLDVIPETSKLVHGGCFLSLSRPSVRCYFLKKRSAVHLWPHILTIVPVYLYAQSYQIN